jgi:hypothetical protein
LIPSESRCFVADLIPWPHRVLMLLNNLRTTPFSNTTMNTFLPLTALAAPLFFQPFVSTDGDEVWSQAELEAVTSVIQVEVEGIRNHDFKHAVVVKLIDGPGFIAYAQKRMDEMTTPEQVSAEENIMKMLALFPADQDLMEVTLALLEGQVGGFYDPVSNAFYLMEAFTGDIAKIILSHELTHALDDQLYDLDGGFAARMANRDALSAYQAVVEGSGTAAMTSWTLQNAGNLDMEALMQAGSMGTESLGEAPEALWKPLLASYTTGQSFLNRGYQIMRKAQRADDKKSGVKTEKVTVSHATDLAFANPPLSTEQILHPEKYWDQEQRDDPREVADLITPSSDWKELDRSVSGELQLALLTGEPVEIDFTDQMELMKIEYTNEAAEGWGGDATVLYGKGDARQLVISTVWDTPEDATEFLIALTLKLPGWREHVKQMDTNGLGSGVLVERANLEHSVTVQVWFGAKP